MKNHYFILVMLALLALSCSKDDKIEPKNEPVTQENAILEENLKTDVSTTGDGCPPYYKRCGHNWCVPYSTSKICHKDVNTEYTTTIQKSLVCTHSWSWVTTKGHSYQVTWDSWYQPTADNSGHTRSINYRCSNNLECGMACAQTKSYYSGWQAHVPTGSPRRCALCGSRY